MPSTGYFIFALAWIVTSSFSYGYHISALNTAQDAITCRLSRPTSQAFLGPCIPMSDVLFGLLTSVYTLGGFMGSIYASRLANAHGRRRSMILASLLIALGSSIMALSTFYFPILMGRFIIGIGCGFITVLVPTFLSEIAPLHIRGSIGVLNQLGIVFGILASQIVSLPLSKPYMWRWIFVLSGFVHVIQLLCAPLMIESPKWAMEQESKRNNTPTDHQEVPDLSDGGGDADDDDQERQELLNGDDGAPLQNQVHALTSTKDLSISDLFRELKVNQDLANGLKLVLITQLAQQLSGINAVLYYSTSIMKSVLPTKASYISLFITFINMIMTFPPLFLVERIGRKSLLVISSSMMALTSLILGFSINIGWAEVSCLAIVGFTASFSIGLGPIPFVIMSEVVPGFAVSSTSSIGLGVNWASNFAVGLFFLPLRNALASPDGDGDGNVFFIFTVISVIATLLISRNYR